jgi:hypothetical protein
MIHTDLPGTQQHFSDVFPQAAEMLAGVVDISRQMNMA